MLGRLVAEKTKGKGNEGKLRYLAVCLGFLLLWLFPRKLGRWWSRVRRIAGLGTVECAFCVATKKFLICLFSLHFVSNQTDSQLTGFLNLKVICFASVYVSQVYCISN